MRLIPLDRPPGALRPDARGWALDLLRAAGADPSGLGDLHVASLAPGAVRGNHRHPNVTEWLLVFGGPVTLAWRAGDGSVERRELPGAEPALVELAPGEAHAVRCDGREPAFLISCANGVPETERVERLL